MSISDYLLNNYPQAPKLKANYTRAAGQASAAAGGPFAGLAGAILGMKAEHTDAQNAQKLQQYGAEKSMYDTLLNWNRQDQVAHNKTADALDQYAREREAEQRKWAREDEVAQKNRDWSLADTLANWNRQDQVAQRNRDWSLNDRQALWDREDKLASNKTADALDQYAKEQAKTQQKRQEELDAAKIRFQNAQDLTRQLSGLANKATHTSFGRRIDNLAEGLGFTTPGAEAEEQYRQIVNNEMIPRIREYMGSSVTEEEGKRVLGLLGDPTAAPARKQAALNSFLAAAERNLKNKQDLANGSVGVVQDNPLGL